MPSDGELHKCAKDGDTETVKELLAAGGTDVNAAGAQGRTALQRALGGGYFECAEALMEGGADPKIADSAKRTCIHYVCLSPTPDTALNCLQLLFDKDPEGMAAIIDNPTKSGSTALHCAVEKRALETVKFLIERGADPSIKDENGSGKSCFDMAKELKIPKDIFQTGNAGQRKKSVAAKGGGIFGKMRRGTKGGDEVKL